MKICIIGGGWTGLVLAYRLLRDDRQLCIIEQADQPGGLATYHDYGGFFWDRFYHVILPQDTALIGLLEEFGLGDQLKWKQTYTGLYVDEAFHSISSTKEFLTFPLLSPVEKFRLAATILLGSRISDWRELEKVSVEDWLVRYSGRATFERFWKPLLLAKLGSSYTRVSAVFIWSYIKRLFEAREVSAARKEKMGYVSGGYRTILGTVQDRLTHAGVDVRLGTAVERISMHPDGGLSVRSAGSTEHFDRVVFTGPLNVLGKVADDHLISIRHGDREVEYLGVACVVLVLRVPLTPFYVLNIADDAIPFTGVIGMSTLVDTSETNGHHLVYLPKYRLSTDPFLRKPDGEIREIFVAGLRKMYPNLSEDDIVSVHVNRAFKVQPLQVLNYSEIVPRIATSHPDLFVLNTAQFANVTLSNDSVTRHVNRFAVDFSSKL